MTRLNAIRGGLSVRVRQLQFAARYKREVARRILHRRRTRTDSAPKAMKVAVVYVYPVLGDEQHDEGARRFVATYKEFAPLAEHRLHVYFNGDSPSEAHRAVFKGVDCNFHQHDDSGWDIGAFQKAAREIDADMMVFLGGYSHFRRAGWLKRMVDVFAEGGDGLYGASASYERDPHIRSTGFWCDPMLVRSYPKAVRTHQQRYDFEASRISLTRLSEHVGLSCRLVTWHGVYGKGQWRQAPNGFRHGDQSDALVYDRAFDLYDAMGDEVKQHHASLADTWPHSEATALLSSGGGAQSRIGTAWYTNEILVGPQFSIGEWTYGSPRVLSYGEDAKLTIGKFCSIAVDAQIFLGGNHRPDWVTTYPFPPLAGD